jgi:hypothetical protein
MNTQEKIAAVLRRNRDQFERELQYHEAIQKVIGERDRKENPRSQAGSCRDGEIST